MEGKLTIDSSPLERPRPAKVMTNKLDYIKKEILPALLKDRNGAPFLIPVNHKLLNIPDYPQVIKQAIDLSKIKSRLRSQYYYNSNECFSDIELMFSNCYVYNLPGSEVVQMGLRLENLYKEKIKLMPSDEYSISVPKRRAEGGKRGRSSGNMKSDISSVGSPPNSVASGRNMKRPESCYDMSPTPSPPKSKGKGEEEYSSKRPRLSEDLRLCVNVLKEITSVRYRHLNEMFLEPVTQKFPNLTDYLEIIKQPMDLGTIKDNLENYKYKNKEEFVRDINLMFNNCYAYNGLESNVSNMATDLQRKFDETYAKLFGLNKSAVQVPNSSHKIEPVVTVTAPIDTKTAIENYQKDLRHLINAIMVLDSNLRIIAENCGESYQSVFHTMPQMNGTLKRHGNHSNSAGVPSFSKKRKNNIDENGGNIFTPNILPSGGVQKRGRKSHHQKLQEQMAAAAAANIANPNLGLAPSNVYQSNVIGTTSIPVTTLQTTTVLPPQIIKSECESIATVTLSNNVVYSQNTISNNTTTNNNTISQTIPSHGQPHSSSTNNSASLFLNSSTIDLVDVESYTSWDARRNLSMMIEKLSGKQLGRVCEIIKENEAAYSDWNLDELDIDFEVLLPQTLRELYRFVYSTFPHNQQQQMGVVGTTAVVSGVPDSSLINPGSGNGVPNVVCENGGGLTVPASNTSVISHQQQQDQLHSRCHLTVTGAQHITSEPPEEGQISDSSSNSSDTSSSKSESSETDSESES